MAKVKRKPGRPTRYLKRVHPDVAERSFGKGMTAEEVAAEIGISRSTLLAWVEEHEEFSRAVTRGKDAADDRVVRALYHNAVGFLQEQVSTVKVYEREQQPKAPDAAESDQQAQPPLDYETRERRFFATAEGLLPPEGGEGAQGEPPARPYKRRRRRRRKGDPPEGLALVSEMRRETRRMLPGQVRAERMWLHNRRPGEWREKQEPAASGTLLLVIGDDPGADEGVS